ncbi:hypothetical protein P22_1114 [Propionispora sp. 2/2-37]|uniref:hypothetical protein n=1 Tax=Propionispora sp. 2/2-37 TaxID=1677858 RepID=UPI0006C52885|nr:hypothetical protein [Propionispora sp. 2/2-37]CUH95045.1 hypothetical protein P22_1114 [Propionispora sp. 2/2-37]
MPNYRVILDGTDTGKIIVAGSYEDAYFDAASTLALTYQNNLVLEEIAGDKLLP